MSSKLPIGLYIHYPWCIKKCPYCDFNSFPKDKSNCSDENYLNAVLSDFRQNQSYLGDRKFVSVYFGGGTPSLFPPKLMEKVLKEISPFLTDATEISMEANPGTVSLDLLKDYKSIGINRLSLGVQSFDDKCLKALGRMHNSKTAIESCEAIVKAGFDNFNLDIMHGLPNQTLDMALNDIKTANSLGCNHLSWYELTLEEDTYFGAHPPKLPNEDELTEIEENGFLLLEELGFNRYEVSGFTKDKRCLHNQNYWYFGDYLGIGAGAHSKVRLGDITYRRANAENPHDYMSQVDEGDNYFYQVKRDELPFEFMLNRLRIFDDVKLEEFFNTTNLDFNVVRDKLLKAKAQGLLQMDDTHYRLTELGRWMLNDILELFL